MLYTQKFKAKVMSEVEETRSLSAVCRKHGVAPSTVSGWIKDANKKVEFKLEIAKKDVQAENKSLKKKLADTELELLILKDLLKKTYQN